MTFPNLFIFDNFFEALARITTHALTDSEKEKVIKGFKSFQERLSSLSSVHCWAKRQIPSRPATCHN
ncbi:hypothetical protein AYI70_g8058 [Smittium culicis]|uniref:Uncharacterized protein n=1 Tax=Smittium culicis TaxID=133412 RepID=A0A1R1XHT2_9FUNG|nr:hypothetical protein AYI70_g8058 [Smittium culicis]